MKENIKWLLYNLTVSSSIYWTGNLILWFPWSINTYLGIALMFTLVPLLWGIGIYNCLIRYQGEKLITGVIINSVIILINAGIEDYIFFGLIRGAMKDLYQPITFFGYAYLVTIPYIELLLFRKLIIVKKREIVANDFIMIGAPGAVCLIILTVIIKFNIQG